MAELRTRLRRAQYAYSESMSRTAQLAAFLARSEAWRAGGMDPACAPSFDSDWAHEAFYAEACYVELWRIVERSSSRERPWARLLPALVNFKPVGVRNARNNNFEQVDHGHRLKGRMGGVHGHRLYPEVTSGSWADPGLHVNVVEFLDDLDTPALYAITELGFRVEL